MKAFCKRASAALCLMLVLGAGIHEAKAQFLVKWIDIGELQNDYIEAGWRAEAATAPRGYHYPAIQYNPSHIRAEAFWIGLKNWTDDRGNDWPYFTAKVGPRESGQDVVSPISLVLKSKWEDTAVTVDGVDSFSKIAVVDEVDPDLPADRVVEATWNMTVGITCNMKVYAYSNDYHDNYHLYEYTFTNTGNTDADAEIELDGQNLEAVYFYWLQRWRSSELGAWVGDGGQVWGKYNMIDVVGDGHADYPVDFTAVYAWHGYEPGYSGSKPWNSLGEPVNEDHWSNPTQGDTAGRLIGGDFDGEMVLYAPNSTTDPTYDMLKQPHTIGWQDQDEELSAAGAAQEDYYELAILTRERQTHNPDISPSRLWPHYADRIVPDGNFWESKNDPSSGRQGGMAPNMAFGPYDMAFGESVRIVTARSIAGLGFDAKLNVGRAYKLSGYNDEKVIEFDANGDGEITRGEFTPETYHNNYDLGIEALTKNQWVMTNRDSLFKSFFKARDVYEASQGFTQYAIPQPPHPPVTFDVFGRPDRIDLTWEPLAGGPERVGWEIYRTSRLSHWSEWYDMVRQGVTPPRRPEDELPYVCVRGNLPDCEGPALAPGETSFNDTNVLRGTDYYYYIVAVGQPQSVDPMGINGTPNGAPLRSSRYYTQTYQPANLKRPPFGETGTIADARVVPNPVNLAADQSIRFAKEDEIAFFNIPGRSKISIYTETGELIKIIEHTDGSGDEKWNLTTDARQLLVSGIYVAVIEDMDSDARVFRKFVVIR